MNTNEIVLKMYPSKGTYSNKLIMTLKAKRTDKTVRATDYKRKQHVFVNTSACNQWGGSSLQSELTGYC